MNGLIAIRHLLQRFLHLPAQVRGLKAFDKGFLVFQVLVEELLFVFPSEKWIAHQVKILHLQAGVIQCRLQRQLGKAGLLLGAGKTFFPCGKQNFAIFNNGNG